MSAHPGDLATPDSSRTDSPFLRVSLLVLAAASAALAFSFYFRGQLGDYNLYYITEPNAHMNEYVPSDASRTLAFPKLAPFACLWAAVVFGGWIALGRLVARREGLNLHAGLRRFAPTFYPLIALLLVPVYHFLGLPLTITPVFLMILCVSLCVAVGSYILRPGFGGRVAKALFGVWAIWVLCLLYAAAFSILSVLEYRALHTGYIDSGIFAEGVHHASRGEALRSNWESTGIALEAHCFLILTPISYLYRLWPRHELLLILQSVGLGLGGVAVYLLAQAVLKSRCAAWCLAVAYWLSPATAFVNLPSTYGFEPMALLVPTMLWALCFLERRSNAWFFLFLLLALLSKEEIAPALVMLGVFIAARRRAWWLAAATAALGIGWFLMVSRVVQPMALARDYRFPSHLSQFGTSAGEVILNVVRHPLATAAHVFGEPVKIRFLLHLVVPLMLLPLLSPSAALVGAANFVILCMATWYGKYVILLGAQAPILPALYLAAVYGLKNLSEREPALLQRLLPARIFGDRERVLHAAALGILAAAALSHYFFFVRTMPWSRFIVTERARMVKELRRRTPRDATLCASYRLASHFTDQRELYVAPNDLTGAHYVVLDLYDEWAGLPTMADYRNRLLRSPEYGPIYAHDGFLIFQRGARGAGFAAAYRLAAEPRPQYPVGKILEESVSLIGYDARPTPSGLELTLYWRCEAEMQTDYAVQLSLAGGDRGQAEPVAWRYLPADGLAPTWTWGRGEIIQDRFVVPGLSPSRDGRPPILSVALEPLQPLR